MSAAAHARRLSVDELESVLAVTRALAAPFELQPLLREITASACQVLHAERCSVWLVDPAGSQLVLKVGHDVEDVHLPLGVGLVGACALEGVPINVPDCYADPRFDPSTDLRTDFRTRCSLSLPLSRQDGSVIGVLQVLNKRRGTFDTRDEALALALAAQCAIALDRMRALEALIASERLGQELALARTLQFSALPTGLPSVDGYDLHASFLPASITGGDTFDLALADQGLVVVIGDAAGHGFAPALAVMQMHAMLRIALRMGADLETAFRHVNDQLTTTLAGASFVTAFIGLLDPRTHRLRYLSGGQGPLLHYQAARETCVRYKATSFPMGAMPLVASHPGVDVSLEPGDVFALLTDGIFEAESPSGEMFGVDRVEQLLGGSDLSAAELAASILRAVDAHVGGADQQDDITMVLVRRNPRHPAMRPADTASS